ncbi:MAG: (d)CMP kinase [Gammaproteobacteria bacterium]|nr:(d)CMP kinase [Gammaproteobacteria bacterium]
MPESTDIPVITIDGPSGAGKGTVAAELAELLGFHLLDSGAVYRAAALFALKSDVDLTDESGVADHLSGFDATFIPNGVKGVTVLIDGVDVSQQLRSEATAAAASKIAAIQPVRELLLPEQREFRQAPGLVADGRDMGTVVFPDATLKVFLTASVEQRAERRAKQLKEKGIPSTMGGLMQEIAERDERDTTRKHSPLVAASNALVVDSSDLSIADVVALIAAKLPSA